MMQRSKYIKHKDGSVEFRDPNGDYVRFSKQYLDDMRKYCEQPHVKEAVAAWEKFLGLDKPCLKS